MSAESQRDPFEDMVPHEIPSTCDWILEKPEFRTWKSTEGPALLLIQGGSGQGKSVMAKAILKRLRKDNPEESSTTLGFFCKSGMIDGNEVECIVRSFLSRLLKQHPECFKHVQKNLSSFRNPNSFRLKDLWRLLTDILSDQNLGPINLVVDGLDECEDESQTAMLTWLKQVFVPITQGRLDLTTRVHFLLTSQPTAAVMEKGRDFNSIWIEAEDIELDISVLIEYKVRDLALDDLGSVEAQKLILEKLKDGAGGTFLWADRILEDLNQLGDDITLGKIQDVLNSNPLGLSEYYERILQRISQEGKGGPARTLFAIILSAPESFQLHDLAVASHLAESSKNYMKYSDIERDLPSKFDTKLRRLCKSFVKVSDPLAERINARIEIMHQSARAFLLDLPQDSPFHYGRLAAHDMMARICLQYLLLDDFGKDNVELKPSLEPECLVSSGPLPREKEGLSSFRKRLSFLHYAGKHWLYHVRESRSELRNCVPFLKQFLRKDSPHFAFWCRSQSLKSPAIPHIIVKHRLQNVLLASAIGTQIPNEPLLNLDIHEVDHEGKTALHLAAEEQSEDLVKLLLNAKADVNAQSKDGWTVLHFATDKVSVSITELLLGAGADASISNHQGWLPIHYIAIENNLAIMTASNQWNTYANATTSHGWTPLLLASHFGHHRMVTWLLDKKVDVNCATRSGITPLSYAAAEGHVECLDQLINAGANVLERDTDGRTAMHHAAKYGHIECLDKLIKAGANILEKNARGWTVLHFATINGHAECLDQLIKAGANVHERNANGWTALHLAATNGHIECLNKLIKAGANINERNARGWTALHVAITNGHMECLDQLIKAGANVHERNANGWTALHYAAANGHMGCLDQLIEAGANVHERNTQGWTALHYAATNGQMECLDRLIKAGVAVHERNLDGSTALHWAAKRGQIKTVNRLLDHGATDVEDTLGSTAFHYAVYECRVEVMQIMIKDVSYLHSLDPFGYLVSEYISRDPELFENIIPLFEKQPIQFGEAERQMKRQTTILRGLRHFRNSQYEKPDYIFDIFGRLLLFAGNVEDARFVFLRGAYLEKQYLKHDIVCTLCRNSTITKARFVCQKCPLVDLCQSCMEKYRSGIRVPGCRGHDFICVPGEDGEISAEEFAQIQETPLDNWFETLLAKYEELPEPVNDTDNNGEIVESDYLAQR